MWKATSFVLALLLAASVTGQKAAPTATILTAIDIDAVRKVATTDTQMVVSDLGAANAAISTMRRASTGKPESPIVHEKVTEIYYVTDGSGVLFTGGTVTGGQAVAADSNTVKVLAGPTMMGGTVHGGQGRRIVKGDWAIIPAGVQHSFASIDGSIEYLMVRIDPDHVLPSGYVHEAVKLERQR